MRRAAEGTLRMATDSDGRDVSEKAARLAAALRENLKRRKAQARARAPDETRGPSAAAPEPAEGAGVDVDGSAGGSDDPK